MHADYRDIDPQSTLSASPASRGVTETCVWSQSKCIIRKARIFKQKDRNPNGLSLKFKIAGGANSIPNAAGWKRE
jgi:hypothetical protein